MRYHMAPCLAIPRIREPSPPPSYLCCSQFIVSITFVLTINLYHSPLSFLLNLYYSPQARRCPSWNPCCQRTWSAMLC